MKANRAQLDRALKAPAETRFFLFHGPDLAGSQALVRALCAGSGPGAERVDLSGAELRADPARLADEAASISLFGGARFIVVDPAGDDSIAAVEALIEAPAAGNPVALVAGALKPSSKLLKIALAAPSALSYASYVPEGRDAERLVADLARAQGLVVRSDLARRIAESCAGNRALIEQELGKLALFADASPEAPRPIDHDALDAIGAASEEGDLSRLVDSVGSGQADLLHAELLRLRSEGIEGVSLVRAMTRRMVVLARLRAEVEGGGTPGAVMASPPASSVFLKV